MSKEAMKRCRCGSYAFNLYKEDIDQGNLCDVHYWQDRAQKAEAKQEQGEPVGMVAKDGRTILFFDNEFQRIEPFTDVYTTPQQRTWVGLTDEDRQAAFESMPDMLDGFLKTWGWLHFSKALEAKLKEKNT